MDNLSSNIIKNATKFMVAGAVMANIAAGIASFANNISKDRLTSQRSSVKSAKEYMNAFQNDIHNRKGVNQSTFYLYNATLDEVTGLVYQATSYGGGVLESDLTNLYNTIHQIRETAASIALLSAEDLSNLTPKELNSLTIYIDYFNKAFTSVMRDMDERENEIEATADNINNIVLGITSVGTIAVLVRSLIFLSKRRGKRKIGDLNQNDFSELIDRDADGEISDEFLDFGRENTMHKRKSNDEQEG